MAALRARLFVLRTRSLALGVATVVAASGFLGVAPSAAVDPGGIGTIGGSQLASTHRTVALLPGAKPLPEVWAETWILADLTSGEVLAQKASHVARKPASTLKMLTALTVLPNTTPQDTYIATRRASDIYGMRVGLKPGRTYTLDQLWYAVFLPSANDAAIAVAEANGGVRKTVRQMQRTASELGALDTVVRNTNGLDAPGQVSSAYDLALIARAGLARDDFATYAGAAKATFPNVKGKGNHPIYTTNRLLLHGFDGMIGVKTGFTSQAGRTYVGAATRDGRTLVVALMGIHEETEKAARKLLKWGFQNADKVTPIGHLIEPGELAAAAASGTGTAVGTSAAAGAATDNAASQSEGDVQVGSAASDSDQPQAPVLGILVLVIVIGGSLLLVVAARRQRRPRGRHAA